MHLCLLCAYRRDSHSVQLTWKLKQSRPVTILGKQGETQARSHVESYCNNMNNIEIMYCLFLFTKPSCSHDKLYFAKLPEFLYQRLSCYIDSQLKIMISFFIFWIWLTCLPDEHRVFFLLFPDRSLSILYLNLTCCCCSRFAFWVNLASLAFVTHLLFLHQS